ncbi:hypothetical protein HKX17_17615 [Sulfitobacter sp. KE34]|uniref:hypothetical protein n=2 Tax=Sulfitobacter TaxID=60136 RepID=UPI0023E330B4|nr:MULTISPECIES: hypothetical protein [unclassified Sulfitobacter]MDF3438705.1 hypothetical protein [Sulfitobacter sp. Ks46]MDF3355590.1 hypothetical protein [Sulfitobacter sp. KE27]MDF3359281.1 hypothetical protein [Sulfitobacter sp. KE33]MDF3366705.1 hypothetical protein [Sulfitobacter sp. Ks34]MDF3370271.1 hypothetical protein [Sulfitobacter sp. Ks43]
MRPETETFATSAEAPQDRLLARWDAHLAARGVCAPRQEDFVSFGSASKLEKLRAALNANRPDQLGCIRLALRQKRSENWRRAHPVKETAENRKSRISPKLSMPEDQLPRSWRRALREMRNARASADRGLIALEDRTPPSASVIRNLASTLRVLARVCEDHTLCAEVSSETIELYRAARHAEGNVSISIASRLKELRIFALWSDLDEQVIAKLLRLQRRYDRAAKRERKRKDVWAAKSGKVLGDVWVKAEELLTLSKAAPGGSALRAGLTLDAACLALSVVCPLRCGDLHRIVIGTQLSRHAEGWSLHIVTRKGERTYYRPELWPELTPFLDALIMLDMAGSDFWEAYEGKCGMALFSRDGGESSPSTSWPTRCWHRHFGIGAHIIRSLWHSLMFESENDDQWIALALCGQGNGRTAKHYILEGRKKQSARRGRAKLQALRHGLERM